MVWSAYCGYEHALQVDYGTACYSLGGLRRAVGASGAWLPICLRRSARDEGVALLTTFYLLLTSTIVYLPLTTYYYVLRTTRGLARVQTESKKTTTYYILRTTYY